MEKTFIIGRKRELELLGYAVESKQPEFVALYGRRRIGKTYLVRQYAKGTKDLFFFDFSGHKGASLSEQIESFCLRLEEVFHLSITIARPAHWKEALHLLTKLIEDLPKKQKVLLFFDELPWIAARNSGFLQALDYIWNQYWSKNTNIKLVVCGSAASWMVDKIINAKGGLHNRVTQRLLLEPFQLNEVQQYLAARKIRIKPIEMLKLYMAIGGVPYYWSLISKGKSSAQLIQSLFFYRGSVLKDEYSRLLQSLFDNSEYHQRIVKTLANKKEGMSRKELLGQLKIKSGGQFNKHLKELEVSGFIQMFIPYGKQKKGHYFRLVDEFCLFYLNWEKEIQSSNGNWLALQGTHRFGAWAGYAFENVCITHEKKMAKALEVESLVVSSSSWRHRSGKGKSAEQGAQVDLLWQRKDGVLQLFEMKYSESPFKLEKSYAKSIQNKLDILANEVNHKGQIFVTLVSPFGLKDGLWNEEVIDSVLTLEDLLFFHTS